MHKKRRSHMEAPSVDGTGEPRIERRNSDENAPPRGSQSAARLSPKLDFGKKCCSTQSFSNKTEICKVPSSCVSFAQEEKPCTENISVGWYRGRRSIPRDENISFDEFTRGVRVLDSACQSRKESSIPSDRPASKLGLVPFSVFEKLSSVDDDEKSAQARATTIHLSFDEDNEEDMFAEAKDETETGEERALSDCKMRESAAMFQGFSSSESEHSQNIAASCGWRKEREELERRQRRDEDFIGFSMEERIQASEKKKAWNIAVNNYEGNIASRDDLEKHDNETVGVESLPRIRELKNLEYRKAADKRGSLHGMREAPSNFSAKSFDNIETRPSPEPRSLTSNVHQPQIGFFTAAGRKIAISDGAIAKARRMYKEIELAVQRHDENGSFQSFTAAGQRESIISGDSAFGTETFANSIENATETIVSTRSDFTTARGGELKVSKESLSKARALFDEIQTKSTVTTNPAISFGGKKDEIIVDLLTARGEHSRISEKASTRAENQIHEMDLESNDIAIFSNVPPRTISSCGFKTAAGRELNISERAFSRAKAQYRDIENESTEVSHHPGNSTTKGRNEFETSASATPPNVPESREAKTNSSCAFKTAAGRELNVSERALSRAKAQYRNIENESTEVSQSPRDSTGKEENFPIGEEAPTGSKSEFDEVEFESNGRATPLNVSASKEAKGISSCGFKTAAGRELNVSERALSRAKAQYRNIENESTEVSQSPRDSTGKEENLPIEFESNGRATPLNVSASKEAKGISSCGFKTAAGRELNVSERALSRAQAQYRNIENDSTVNSSKSNAKVESRLSQGLSSSSQARKRTDRPIEPPNQFSTIPDSLNFQDFTMDESEDSSKRKYDQVDDDTPMRREPPWKRTKGRSANDVQGRKLFDDEDPPSVSIVGGSTLDPYVGETNNEPTKMLISDEINASAAALVEDEERSLERTKGHPPSCKETESIPDDLTFDSQFSQEHHHARVVDDFIAETIKMMEARLAMISKQDEIIRGKRRVKPQALDGTLYRLRTSKRDSRFSWRELTGGEAPVARENSTAAVDSEVLKVTANSAGSYSFSCAEFYGGKNVGVNAEGIKVGDDAFLILDERNRAGAREFEIAFLASPGVDPNLVPAGWVRNHYRWIVWKLASMDRVRFGHKCLPRMLTPSRVMLELKYRYDREIHRTQWPPLRRILEKNEDAAARLVLCVAGISIEEGNETPAVGMARTPGAQCSTKCAITLTDGWYSIPASVDAAFVNCVKSGKVKEGTKLVTCGAKVMNLDQGCSVLEIPESVALRIHANSTRRARWDTKLDFCRPNRGPIALSLKSIKPNGGAICKLTVAVARSYPVLYREKLPDGQFVFRNARCDEEAALAHEARCQAKMEEIFARATRDFQPRGESSGRNQEEEIREKIASELRDSLPPPRNVTPVLKIRLADNDTSAMMTIWSTGRETDRVFEEGSSLVIYNSFASGQRCNELQITASRNTVFSTETRRKVSHPERTCTRLSDVGEPDFNPPYGEFDTVGIVVSIGPAPHGMKNFETVNLARPTSEDAETSDFLSILFWQGVSSWGFSKILDVGASVACMNLEWRRNTSRRVPTAYCTERSIFTRNPRRKHLAKPLESLSGMTKDAFSYASECAAMIREEIAKKTLLRTPGNSTMFRGVANISGAMGSSPRESASSPVNHDFTPKNHSRKASIMRRIERLEAYGEPPKLPPMAINHSSPKVLSEFRSPVFTPVTK